MRRIPEDSHAPVSPRTDRVSITQHPKLPVLTMANDILGARMNVTESAEDIGVRHS
jgi:hypothetical protein